MPKKKMGMPFYRFEERIPTDDFEEIIYEKDPPIGRLILNTPEKRNPLSYQRIVELSMAFKRWRWTRTSGSSSSRAPDRVSRLATT